MAKLTKAQRKAHAEAEAILTKDKISDDERDFVFQNWHERLSFRSSFLNGPRLCVPYDCVEDCEEMSQAGDDGDFLWPSARDEALVIGLDEGVVSGGDEGGHV